jgi:hypothetical protein
LRSFLRKTSFGDGCTQPKGKQYFQNHNGGRVEIFDMCILADLSSESVSVRTHNQQTGRRGNLLPTANFALMTCLCADRMHTIERIKQLTDEGRGRQLLSCQIVASVLCCNHFFRLNNLRITPEDIRLQPILVAQDSALLSTVSVFFIEENERKRNKA